MVGVIGTASRIFGALASNSVNVILITQASSEHSICLAVLPKDGLRAKAAIEEEFKWEIKDKVIDEVIVETNMSVIAVVSPAIACRTASSTPRASTASARASSSPKTATSSPTTTWWTTPTR